MTAHPKPKPNSPDPNWISAAISDASHPSAATLQALGAFEGQLALWRHSSDLSRRLIRRTQDQTLKFWRAQLTQLEDAAAVSEKALPTQPFLMPMIAAIKTAEQFGSAALDAQRYALDAINRH